VVELVEHGDELDELKPWEWSVTFVKGCGNVWVKFLDGAWRVEVLPEKGERTVLMVVCRSRVCAFSEGLDLLLGKKLKEC